MLVTDNRQLIPGRIDTADANIISHSRLGFGTLQVGYIESGDAVPAKFVADQGKQCSVLLNLKLLAVTEQPAHGYETVWECNDLS